MGEKYNTMETLEGIPSLKTEPIEGGNYALDTLNRRSTNRYTYLQKDKIPNRRQWNGSGVPFASETEEVCDDFRSKFQIESRESCFRKSLQEEKELTKDQMNQLSNDYNEHNNNPDFIKRQYVNNEISGPLSSSPSYKLVSQFHRGVLTFMEQQKLMKLLDLCYSDIYASILYPPSMVASICLYLILKPK